MEKTEELEPMPIRSLALTIKRYDECIVIHDKRTGEKVCAIAVIKAGSSEARVLFKATDSYRIVREDLVEHIGRRDK